MPLSTHSWTEEKLRAEALKYSTRREFSNESPGAYQTSRKSGKHEEICSHMLLGNQSWTEEKIKAEALKYSTRGDFKKGNVGAYNASQRSGKHEEICSHMAQGFTGFSKSQWARESKTGFLYVLLCEGEKEKFLKLGITKNSLEKRFPCQKSMPYNYKILGMWQGSPEDIFNLEVSLKRLVKHYRYQPQKEFGGQTECFSVESWLVICSQGQPLLEKFLCSASCASPT